MPVIVNTRFASLDRFNGAIRGEGGPAGGSKQRESPWMQKRKRRWGGERERGGGDSVEIIA